MIQLKHKALKHLREKWHNEQDGICPILKKAYPIEFFCVDHQHKLINESPSEDGKGLCRGAIHLQANSLEGKISKAYKRLGLHKHIELTDYLRNLADYLESNRIHTGELLIHPTEAPKKKKLLKSSWNELKKAILNDNMVNFYIPEYKDKRGNLSKELEKLFSIYNIIPKLR